MTADTAGGCLSESWHAPEDHAAAEAALFSLIADFLALRDPDARPAIVWCSDGTYAPRVADRQGVKRQLDFEKFVAAHRRLVDHLCDARPNLLQFEISRTNLCEIGRLVRQGRPSHAFVLPPPGWSLEYLLDGGDGASQESRADATYLGRLGIPRSRYLGDFFSTLLLAVLLRESSRGVVIGTVATPLHLDRSGFLREEIEQMLRPLRRSIVSDAALLDVTLLDTLFSPYPEVPLLVRESEWGRSALIGAVRGKGPARARFRRMEERKTIPAQVELIRNVGGFCMPVGDVGADWISIGNEDLEAWWEPERHSEAHHQIRSSFVEHGQWVEFSRIVSELPTIEDPAYRSEPIPGRAPVPVICLEDYERILEGSWDGTFSEVTCYSGPEPLEPRLVQPGDLILYIGGMFGPPRDWALIAGEEHAGCVPDWELRVFRIKPEFEYARDWILALLRSEAFAEWLRVTEPASIVGPEHLMGAAVPLPSRPKAVAFASSARLEERLREVADELQSRRNALVGFRANAPGWVQFGRLVGHVRALERALHGLGELDALVRFAYPRPLANAFREMLSASRPKEQLEIALRLVEGCAAYVAAVRLAELEASGQLSSSGALVVLRHGIASAGGMTFGSWVQILRASGASSPTSPLAVDISEVLSNEAFFGVLEQARELRNAFAHHRLSDAECAMRAPTAVQLVRGALQGLEPLVAYELVVVERALNDPKVDFCHSFGARLWSGDHPRGEVVSGSAAQHLLPEVMYLRGPDDRWIVPSPFLIVGRTDSSGEEICVPDRVHPGTGELAFRPLASADQVSDRVAAEHLRTMLGLVRDPLR